MAKKPIIYDPAQPAAHYQEAGKRYKKVKSALDFGIIMPLISLACGIASIAYSEREMAVFALCGISFTMLAVIGCSARRSQLCLISIPLAFIAGFAAMAANELFSPIGLASHLIAAIAELRAMYAIDEFYKLKELPGFPTFNQSLDDISFAAKDHRGTAEFIDSSEFNKGEKTVYRINPDDVVKSDDMGEIVTGVSLRKDGVPIQPDFSDEMPELEDDDEILEPEPAPIPIAKPAPVPRPSAAKSQNTAPKQAPPQNTKPKKNESTYEKMVRIQPNNNNDVSDIDLFDMM